LWKSVNWCKNWDVPQNTTEHNKSQKVSLYGGHNFLLAISRTSSALIWIKYRYIIQSVPETLSLEVRRPRREADHSPLHSAKTKEWVELYLHSPNTSSCIFLNVHHIEENPNKNWC
jgi:hypothetical protein